MNKFFTFGARKTSTSVIVISQNPYSQSRFGVTIRRQMSYIICFPSKMDKHPIISLGRQICPSKPNWILKCLDILSEEEEDPTKIYILLDCHTSSRLNKALQARTNIFDDHPYFFVMSE